MHFQALRGSNAAEDCSVIFITGRNMPPPPEIDLKARALFWDAAEPLQHDEFGSFRPAGAEPVTIPTQFRGYVQSSRNPLPQSGVHVPAFSDARVDALLAQSRDAETMQALGRLRLVHAKYQKRVFLLSNLPVEVPVDQLVPFSDLMPDRLELELIRRGNVPLTPLGLLKMRPDLVGSSSQAEKLLQRSNVRDPSRLRSLPELVRAGLLIVEFEAENAGRTNIHRHLFMLPDQQGHRDEDHPEVIVSAGSVPMAAWIKLLEQGEDGIEGSGWGGVHNPRLVEHP